MLARAAYFVLSLTLVALVQLTKAEAQDDRARARAEFQRGVEAYERADYSVALEAFSEAYRLAPHPVVRVNLANSYERLGRPVEALLHFELFLSEAERAPAQQRREIEAAIRRLRTLVGELELRVSPDGARVTIDGAEPRLAPLTEPVRVPAGLHTVVVELEGHRSTQRQLQVAGGERVGAEILLEPVLIAQLPEPEEPAITVAENAPEEGTTSSSFEITVPTWIVGGITLGAALGAGVTGGLALAANSDFDAQLAIYENPFQDAAVREEARLSALSSADRADTLALVTDVLLVTTVVGAGVTLVVLFTTQDDGDPGGQEATAIVAPLMGEGLAGVLVVGAF